MSKRWAFITILTVTTVVLSTGGLFLLLDRRTEPAERSGVRPAPVALGNNEPIMMAPDATSSSISITLSQAAYPDGSADAAILARDDTWAYAIATGGIQGVLGGPLLLTSSQRLSPGVLDELRRVGAEKVYLIGGEAALAPAVARVLTEAGYQIERIGGANAIETALATARRLMPGAHTAVLLGGGRTLPDDRGRGAVDALAAGSWAAMHDAPVLLTDPYALSPATREYIRRSRITDVMIVGGTMAVAAPVKEELERLGVRVERVGGENRYDTAAQIVELWGAHNGFLLIDGSTERLSAAGFAAAAYSMRANAPVLLANSGTLPPETGRMLNGLRQPVQLICAPGVEKDPCMTAQELSAAIRGR